MNDFSHIGKNGGVQMVNCSDKELSQRTARASVTVHLNQETFGQMIRYEITKGNVLTTAQLAGIQAAKKTSELIPLCHAIPLSHVEIRFELDDSSYTILIVSTVRCIARTGAEMEALCACSVAALTIYDMLKAIQRDITITDLKLLQKTGGKSGDFARSNS